MSGHCTAGFPWHNGNVTSCCGGVQSAYPVQLFLSASGGLSALQKLSQPRESLS